MTSTRSTNPSPGSTIFDLGAGTSGKKLHADVKSSLVVHHDSHPLCSTAMHRFVAFMAFTGHVLTV
jgi:hypothetical protein